MSEKERETPYECVCARAHVRMLEALCACLSVRQAVCVCPVCMYECMCVLMY